MTEAHVCVQCGQLIQYHEGLRLVVNMGPGPGGDIGERHICPYRVGSQFHKYKPVNLAEIDTVRYCPMCKTRWDSAITGFCHCFIQECKCGHRWRPEKGMPQQIRIESGTRRFIPDTGNLYKDFKAGKGRFIETLDQVVYHQCPACGSYEDNRQVDNIDD